MAPVTKMVLFSRYPRMLFNSIVEEDILRAKWQEIDGEGSMLVEYVYVVLVLKLRELE